MFYGNNNNIFGLGTNKHKHNNKHITDVGKPENNYKIIREIIDSEMKARVNINNKVSTKTKRLLKQN